MSNLEMMEIKSKIDLILANFESLKERVDKKVYTTEELCEYLGVGKSVIEHYKRNGELAYSKLGRTYIFTQKDVEVLLEKNRVNYVA